MTEQASLFPGVRRMFWGYFFLLLDFDLNLGGFTLPLLANVVGWALVFWGIDALAFARPSLKLLSPFGAALAVCSLTQFVPAVEDLLPGWLSLIIALVTLYTHFQLLTDLAALADGALEGGELGRRLRACRTFLVLTQTLLYLQDPFLHFPALVFALMAAALCVIVFLLYQLWVFSRSLRRL